MHNGLVLRDGEKMSKSLGNVISVREALERWTPDALRLFVLSSHYRSPNNVTDEALVAAQRGVDRLTAALRPSTGTAAADDGELRDHHGYPIAGPLVPPGDEAHTRFPAFRPAPDPAVVERAVAAVKASKKPVIVADRGAIIAGAGAALAALAERIQAPVVATLDAKHIIVETHKLFRGTVGLYGRGCANHVVDEADLVIYAGSNTSDHTTANYVMPKQGTKIIQIDIDPLEIGRNYAGTIGMLADVRAGLEALAAKADAAKHDDWLAHTQKFVDEWRVEAEKARASDAVPTNR